MKKEFLAVLFILLPLAIGSLLGFLYRPDERFKTMKKPSFMPPSVAFQIVWPILYILIGISLYYGIYYKEFKYWIIPILNLICNFSFSPIMFGLYNLYGAYIVTFLTLITAIMMFAQFYMTKNRLSAILLVPYILWLFFATFLAYNVYVLNI